MSYCDCDSYSDPYWAETRKARIRHRCGECWRWIEPGENYEHVRGKCDGEMFVAKTCSHCLAILNYVTAHVPCFCLEHGNMLDAADEEIREWGPTVPGMGMEYGRLRVALKRAKVSDDL